MNYQPICLYDQKEFNITNILNKNVIYISYIGIFNDEHTFKFGISSDVIRRELEEHQPFFDTFKMIYINVCNNNRTIETIFKNDLKLRKIHRKLKINDKQLTELFCINEQYSIEVILMNLETIIKDNQTKIEMESKIRILETIIKDNQTKLETIIKDNQTKLEMESKIRILENELTFKKNGFVIKDSILLKNNEKFENKEKIIRKNKECKKCKKCNKKFKTKCGYQGHVKRDTCDNKKNICEYCFSRFKNKTSFYYHIRTKCKDNKLKRIEQLEKEREEERKEREERVERRKELEILRDKLNELEKKVNNPRQSIGKTYFQ
jgi:hypothetical protein